MLRQFSSVIFIFLMVLPGAVSGISVSQSLSANQINYEDSAAFEIVLKWTGSQSAFLFNKPLRPLMAKLKVRGYSSSIESAGAGADEITTKTYRFTLIPSSAGLGTIEPITIEYLAWPDSIPGLLMTEQMSLTIARPRPAPKVDDGRATVWLWIIVPTVVALGAAAWWWSRRNKIAPVVVQSPVDIFLKKLGETRTAAGTDLKVFQTGVHRLLAEFVKARCDFYAEGKSSDEIRSALVASGVTERTAERITGWYLRAEEDKFRPVEAGPGETIRLEAEIRSCFEEI